MPSAERWPSLTRVSPQTSALEMLSVKQVGDDHRPTSVISPPEQPRSGQPQPTSHSFGEASPRSQADQDAVALAAPEASPAQDFSPVSAAALEVTTHAIASCL